MLIVDDEEFVLVAVTKMLERLGYDVLSARSGPEVVDRLHQKRNKIDMVIMDMVMPDIGPDQILEAIREHNPRAKVLLSSGFELSSAGNKGLLNRTDGFLQKPYQLAELEQILQATLNTHRASMSFE